MTPAAPLSRVLIVDDDPGVRYTLREILESEGVAVDEASSGEEALAKLDENFAPLVITDLRMPGMDGMALLAVLTQRAPAPRVVLVTAHGSERTAVEAMKAGAWDYFRKPFEVEELMGVVRRALEAVRLAHENERLKGELTLGRTMVFGSDSMRRLAVLLGRVAPRDVNVLISGESGTGKERVAQALVLASPRVSKPFVKFNCAALAPELAEAELFGHARGAFTGAVRSRPGLFGEADGGTLLLDEIGELAPPLQGKLLRAIQEGEVKPVGEKAREVDVRVIAATHRDLAAEVRAGRFREDLFYRLNVVHLRVPPLREHPEDIRLLARHFLDRFSERYGVESHRATEAVIERLVARPWPGNVRELENTLERLVALSPQDGLDLSLLAEPEQGGEAKDSRLPLRERVEAYERGLVVEALREAQGNRSEAARRLGISRVTFHDKLRKWGLGGTED